MMSTVTYISHHNRNEKTGKIKESSSITETAVKKINPDKRFKAVIQNLDIISSIPYYLYIYRKELRRRPIDTIQILEAKIELTNTLVIENVNKIHNCLDNGVSHTNFENEMNILTREVVYKKKLQNKIDRIEEDIKRMEKEKNKAAKKRQKADQKAQPNKKMKKC